ncbi:hypothetical protein [Ferruginibacter albus]|uniref:hypothetical protein n=1 Tax=Ferruginibacter albus TaxID=2875540 RepID=UPI001CC6033C|nr:hypothetical protein [Ferruginibacter albus]UAY50889.1 hypothetical protein K9M53_09835 [Ferruginibacter albus]
MRRGLFLMLSFFIVQFTFAQSTDSIEKKLSKVFSKIHYYGIDFYDSLEKINNEFEKLLLTETATYPQTLYYQFKSLKDSGLNISTSADGNFRIYSWDTWTGGTMHLFRNVFQYKANGKVFSKPFVNYDTDITDCSYYEMHQVTSNNKHFYVTFGIFILSSALSDHIIQIFSIDGSKLNDNAKLIKTKTGLQSQLRYEVDGSSPVNQNKEIPDFYIKYDNANKIISIPLILGNNEVTKKRIKYKFTGVYFEKFQALDFTLLKKNL